MDSDRYGLHQRWDNNSDLERYETGHDSDFRSGGSYNDRRLRDERFSREKTYPKSSFHRDPLETDNHPRPPSATSMWSQTRRRSYEGEVPLDRDYRRREKSSSRFGGRDHEDYAYDDYDYRSHVTLQSREMDYEYGRQSYDSDYDSGGGGDGNLRRHVSRERQWDKRGLSREKDESLYRRREHSRPRSRSYSGGHERSRSSSPRGRSHRQSQSHREDSYDVSQYDRSERHRDREDRRYHDQYSAAPSATVVVKGLSQRTTEEDLYTILAEWGPLRHVRVIKERSTGISRGFAFIDFPAVDAARAMMDRLADDGLVLDDRKLFFEYSSKSTWAASGPLGIDTALRSCPGSHRGSMMSSDWMCIICGCVNFARRTSCFQCNEPRTEDAPAADMGSSNPTTNRRGELGPTHVLVVRGLDEDADEEMLRYEFSKSAPIKDLRLVRDKFTHVSRGFAFVHFHSVDDATKALELTNGTTLEKNGQILRVAYAKSIIGSASVASGASQSSTLAAAAIEAATFAQQYDAVGWAPKEYNPEDKQSTHGAQAADQKDSSAPQSGFVWDEASGYYYDAASGFYYDGNTGLYYDGNNGLWYSFDQQTQQYISCSEQNNTSGKQSETSKPSDGPNTRKVVISAPAATITSLPDAVQAGAIAAEKKEKEKLKEIKLASKSSILANKKKMNNVLSMWKQRSHERGRVVLNNDNQEESSNSAKSKLKNEVATFKENIISIPIQLKSQDRARLAVSGSGETFKGVIRSSGVYTESPPVTSTFSEATIVDASTTVKKGVASSCRRRFSETASLPSKEEAQNIYRDRAAERRSLYGSSADLGDELSNGESSLRRGVVDSSMPFPPGVGGGRSADIESYDVISADKAIDERNVGNRMLRSMGWQEGSGLGRDGSGMVEPVQAQATETRAGLGSHQPKKAIDPTLEVQAGDTYRAVIHKKAIARFREMS